MNIAHTPRQCNLPGDGTYIHHRRLLHLRSARLQTRSLSLHLRESVPYQVLSPCPPPASSFICRVEFDRKENRCGVTFVQISGRNWGMENRCGFSGLFVTWRRPKTLAPTGFADRLCTCSWLNRPGMATVHEVFFCMMCWSNSQLKVFPLWPGLSDRRL